MQQIIMNNNTFEIRKIVKVKGEIKPKHFHVNCHARNYITINNIYCICRIFHSTADNAITCLHTVNILVQILTSLYLNIRTIFSSCNNSGGRKDADRRERSQLEVAFQNYIVKVVIGFKILTSSNQILVYQYQIKYFLQYI